MFRGKIHLYRNTDGKEEEIQKEFDDENDFNSFIDGNPELKKLQGWAWESPRWPYLRSVQDRLDEARNADDQNFFEEMKEEMEGMEKRMQDLFERSKKFLKK